MACTVDAERSMAAGQENPDYANRHQKSASGLPTADLLFQKQRSDRQAHDNAHVAPSRHQRDMAIAKSH